MPEESLNDELFRADFVEHEPIHEAIRARVELYARDVEAWERRLPPLDTPTDVQLAAALADYAAAKGLLAAANIVKQYGGQRLRDLKEDGRQFLYWELTQTLIEELL